jgi:hypothetical protein
VETDNDDNAPRLETVVENALKCAFELFQFAVNGNPQGLEDARGGMAAG